MRRQTDSVWQGTARDIAAPPLDGDASADVVIIGGGITGVTIALRLADAGRSVVLLEAGEIGGGATGRSTGNLYQTVAAGLHTVADKWGDDVAQRVVQARSDAISLVERHASRFAPGCGWRRCALYRFASGGEQQPSIEQEHRAARAAGLDVRREPALPGGLAAPAQPALVFDGQAQLHPLAYVRSLARRAIDQGCRIHARSAALAIDRDRGAVQTARGEVRARDTVLATHSPSGFHVVQAEMVPRQEYGVAFATAQPLPPGIFWDADTRLSLRGVEADGRTLAVCVGEPHKTGQHDAADAGARLEAAARRRLGGDDVAFRWSAQNFRSADGLPYVGRDLSGAYIATGFATDGLVWGTLAAGVIADQLLGVANPLGELLRPGRFEPVKAAQGVVEENLAVAKALVRGYLSERQTAQLETLPRGHGAIVELDGDTVAAYRDADGTLFAVSPVCTHLKCKVRWNAFESSWDCPCHGSRFAPDGRVIEGPAIEPLARKLPPARPT